MVVSVGRVNDVGVEIVEVELFTAPGNNAIVRMPGRAFPAVLVQGDTLSIVREHVAGAARLLASRNGAVEALDQPMNNDLVPGDRVHAVSAADGDIRFMFRAMRRYT